MVRRVPLLFNTISLVAFSGMAASAQIRLPKVPNPFDKGNKPPITIPGGDPKNALVSMLTDAFGPKEAPFVLDPNQIFDRVSADQAPTSDNFKPVALKFISDLSRPLPPGDYSLKMLFYCTEWSRHLPGRGHPYTLGRAQGRLARQMHALLFRGTLRHLPPATLNAMAWRIQAGVPLSQWSDEEKKLVHELVPEYEKDLGGNWLQRIEGDYNRTLRLLTRKPFDEQLRELGGIGTLALNFKAAYVTLADKRVVPERLPLLMFQQFNPGADPQLPPDPDHPSPWMQVSPGVMIRFTPIEGHLRDNNILDLWITPEAQNQGAKGYPSAAEIINGTGNDEGKGLVGHSKDSQSPMIEPVVEEDFSVQITSYLPIHDDTQKDDPNKIILPLQAQVSPKEKIPSVQWEFTLIRPSDLTKPEADRKGASVLSFSLSTADCVDKVYNQPLDVKTLNLEGELTITAQVSVNGKSKNTSVKVYLQPITDDFSVRDIPGIMRNIGAETNNSSWYKAAEFLEHWFEGSPVADTMKTLNWNLEIYKNITLDWILSEKSGTNADGKTSKRVTNAYNLLLNQRDLVRILTRPNARGESAIDVLRKHLQERKDYKVGATITFPIQNIREGMHPDQKIHNEHIQHIEVHAPSIENLEAPIDPIFATIGDFSFYIIPIGTAKISDMGASITITKIAVYTASSFHFVGLHNGLIGLGFWKKPDKISVTPGLRYTHVQDKDFIDYRSKFNHGQDFIVLSDIRIIELAENIETLPL